MGEVTPYAEHPDDASCHDAVLWVTRNYKTQKATLSSRFLPTVVITQIIHYCYNLVVF